MITKLRIKPHISVIPHSASVVELRFGVWNSRSFSIEDENQNSPLAKIVLALQDATTAQDVAANLNINLVEVNKVIVQLQEIGVIESAIEDSSHTAYLEEYVPLLSHLSGGCKPSKVVIHATDEVFDEVKKSLADLKLDCKHINIQELLGEHYGCDAKDGLEFVECVEKCRESLKDSFLVYAESTVNPVQTLLVNSICVELGVKWIYSAIDGPFILTGPTFAAKGIPCFACLEQRVLANMRQAENYVRLKKQAALTPHATQKARIAPVLTKLQGALLSLEMANLVTTGHTYTERRMLAIYLPTFEISFNEVLPIANCEACGTSSYRDNAELFFDLSWAKE